MNKHALIFIGILAVVGLIAAFFVQAPDVVSPLPNVIDAPAPEVQTYTAPEQNISFTYPMGYFLKEIPVDGGRVQHSLVIVEDTQENRNVIEGRATEPRDGPTAITLEVYPNPNRLPAEDWVRSDTNWNIRTSDVAPMGRGSITGVTYTWSGLYEGRSVIVTEGMLSYVFSVTWLTPDDAILTAFDEILSSVVLTAPATQ